MSTDPLPPAQAEARVPDEHALSTRATDDFVTAACRWPDRTAVVHNDVEISYRELARRVERTALRYCCGDFGAEAASGLVGVVVSHNPALAEHLLAIMRAGATYCPIDAALPPARREALGAVLGVQQLVTADPSASETPPTGDPGRTDCTPRQPFSSQHDRAYALCTSGSTGTPKPVAVSHTGLAVTVRALRDLFGLTPHDRVLQFASLSWDTSLEELLPTLTAGAAVIFDDAAHCGSVAPFLRMLARQRVTVLDLPTAFWHELVWHLYEEHATLPESIRLVVIGGERVDPNRLRQWRELDTQRVELLNTYGCTETTMITHAVQLSGPGTEPGVAASDQAPIGRALPHVSDQIGDDGELMVSGPGVALGYLGLPIQTATAFPHADHGSGMARWFRTGDLVTRGANNLLYSRGRADEEIKVLGARIHPAEVEAQLHSHPAVYGAAVVGERALGRTTLTAYVVARDNITARELKHFLRDRLPHQFVPSTVQFVDELAYTRSGKIDRAATRRAASERQQQQQGVRL